MRRVNLLPEGYRPRTPRALSGSAYMVVGVLAVLVVMLAVYTLSSNQVNSRQGEIAQAEQETRDAEARAGALAGYGAFATVKQTRLESVRRLATVRFDWERMMRELALVLPSDTWLLDMNASTVPQDGSAPAGAPAAPASGGASAGGSGTGPAPGAPVSPSLTLSGCAKRQRDVAVLMVRLRKLYRADDVELTESAEEGADGSPSTDGGGAGASNDGCPSGRYKWQVTVKFSDGVAAGKPDVGRLPARLGGGA